MSKKWYIWLDGKEIPVTEEVYRTYKRAEWREEKQDALKASYILCRYYVKIY